MSVSFKSPVVQGHHVLLSSRSPALNLLDVRGTRTVRQPGWTLDAWILRGGHVLSFSTPRGARSWETLADLTGHVPETGTVAAFPALGEREFEHRFDRDGFTYMNTLQSENLSEHPYEEQLTEVLAHGRTVGALVHAWTDHRGQHLSMVEIQRYPHEVHCETYHFYPQGGLVIRSQTLFECVTPARVG